MVNLRNKTIYSATLLFSASIFFYQNAAAGSDLEKQNSQLFKKIEEVHKPSPEEMDRLKNIFKKSGYIGQGNPKVTVHPMTVAECKAKLKSLDVDYQSAVDEEICGSKYMAPIFNKKTGSKEKAMTCIDKFEFPNIPCEYPVVWVRADEAANICKSVGKRMCDAHEWEGACAGDLRDPGYDFSLAEKLRPNDAIKKMRYAHNAKERKAKTWSYGDKRKTGICAANGSKSKGCNGEGWKKCGSNTFPTGAYPDCKSSFDVYDIHGNAAEHMNLPILPNQMAGAKNSGLGYTEMKGSWFIFDKYKAHKDFCRWRAPFWHGTKVMNPRSHHNYHLGFRCCKDISQTKNDLKSEIEKTTKKNPVKTQEK